MQKSRAKRLRNVAKSYFTPAQRYELSLYLEDRCLAYAEAAVESVDSNARFQKSLSRFVRRVFKRPFGKLPDTIQAELLDAIGDAQSEIGDFIREEQSRREERE